MVTINKSELFNTQWKISKVTSKKENHLDISNKYEMILHESGYFEEVTGSYSDKLLHQGTWDILSEVDLETEIVTYYLIVYNKNNYKFNRKFEIINKQSSSDQEVLTLKLIHDRKFCSLYLGWKEFEITKIPNY